MHICMYIHTYIHVDNNITQIPLHIYSNGQFTSDENQNNCKSMTTCSAGQYISTKGTSTTDRKCKTCSNGQFTIIIIIRKGVRRLKQ